MNNFEQWFKKNYPDNYIDGPWARQMETGWNSCKSEILKVLEENRLPESNTNGIFDIDGDVI